MATNIFLGFPPENIKKFIIENYGPKEDPMLKVPLTFTATGKSSIQLHCPTGMAPEISLEYAIDDGEFVHYDTETTI